MDEPGRNGQGGAREPPTGPQTSGALRGQILGPKGWVIGEVLWANGRVSKVGGQSTETVDRAPGAASVIVPGFIDLHVHGGGGRDTMEGRDAVRRLAQTHARHGTTALLATTMTAPVHEIEAALRDLAPQCIERAPAAARVLGVHLEGPYINPEKLGAQPPYAKPATVEEVLRLRAIAPIRVLTLAPEVPGNLALIPQLVAAGIRVQVGHTQATYEEVRQALERGATGFTHLFNAMSPLHHRSPGAVGAALAHAAHAELIPDLLHVHPGAIHAALRAVPGLFAVTDATAAAGMPDGTYPLGSHMVHKCMGGVRLPDGTLAGSALTMDQALRNLVQIGLPLEQACARVSLHAARYLGLQDRGELARGAWADMVVLNPATLQVLQVVVEGEVIDAGAEI